MGLQNAFGGLASETSLSLLRAIFRLLKPLGMVTGGGSNRLSVDINSGTIGTVTNITNLPTLATVTTVATVSSMTNAVNLAGITAFELLRSNSRISFTTGLRGKM